MVWASLGGPKKEAHAKAAGLAEEAFPKEKWGGTRKKALIMTACACCTFPHKCCESPWLGQALSDNYMTPKRSCAF
jgi:hypothetical protein